MASDIKSWREVVEKLLKKAESTDSEHERNELVEKATYLMAKYGIEEALLFANDNKEHKVVQQTLNMTNPHRLKKSALLYGIATAFGCVSVRMGDGQTTRITGYSEDIEKVLILYNSLLVQMFVALFNAEKEKPEYVHGKTFADSFLKGFVSTVVGRVKSAYDKARHDVGSTGKELVLRNRREMVLKSVLEWFPDFKEKAAYTNGTSRYAYGLGVVSGHQADIGQSRIGSRTAIEQW